MVGSPRSGTTLFRNLLVKHLDLAIPPESSWATYLLPQFGQWSQADLANGRLEEFLKHLSSARKFENWGLNTEIVRDWILFHNPNNYSSLVAEVYRCWASSKFLLGRSWGDKNNVHGLHLHELRSLFPEATMIWLLRHPIQVVESQQRLAAMLPSTSEVLLAPTPPATEAQALDDWIRFQTAVRSHFLEFSGEKKFFAISFSDLVANTESEIARIAGLVGVPFRPKPLADVNSLFGGEMDYSWKTKSRNSPSLDAAAMDGENHDSRIALLAQLQSRIAEVNEIFATHSTFING